MVKGEWLWMWGGRGQVEWAKWVEIEGSVG